MALRRPNQGLITQPIPAFYPERMYGGTAGTNGVASHATVALGFYNADTLGRSIVVWHLEVQYKPGTSGVPFITTFFQVIRGTNTWTPAPAVPIVGGGQAGIAQVVNAYDLNWPTDNTFYQAFTDNFHWIWPHDYPIAVVPPGWSFFAYSDPSFTGGGGAAILMSGLVEAAPTRVS